MSGVQTEGTADAGGGLNVGWIDPNDWMDYSINVTAAGTYTVNFRVAATVANAQFQLKKSDGTVLATVNVPNTWGFQNWQTVSATVNLSSI
jgi:endoglucanase